MLPLYGNVWEHPEKLEEKLFADDEDSDYTFSEERRIFRNFINSIHSLEDYLKKVLGREGHISIKEFLKLNDLHGDTSIVGAVFDAKTRSWSNPIQFTSNGRLPKIEKTSSGEVLAHWTSWDHSNETEHSNRLDQYTDEEIEDSFFGRFKFPIRKRDNWDDDDESEEWESYLVTGSYDYEKKSWVLSQK